MPEIRIFADKLTNEPAEILCAEAGVSVAEWLRANVPSFRDMPEPPISIAVDGEVLKPKAWETRQLEEGAVVDIVCEPGTGLETFELVMLVISLVSAAYTIYMLNNLPDAPTLSGNIGKGSSIYDPNAQGNKPRMMLPVPEIFGRHPIFPDYICQPRRVYISDEQWLYLNLCIGRGTYTVHDLYIGNTPVSSYADDIIYQVKGPGESVTGHAAHMNVYTSPEVGSTSGSAGFEPLGVANMVATQSNHYAVFSGNVVWVLINTLNEFYSWHIPAGVHVEIVGATVAAATYTGVVNFVDGATIGQTVFTGLVDIVDNNPNADSIVSRNGVGLDVFGVGAQVAISGAGANDGTYYINTVSASTITLKDGGGTPITNLTPMTSVSVTITSPGSSSTPDEIRSTSGSGLDVLTVGAEVVISGAGSRDGTYYIRSSSAGTITLKDSGGNAITGLAAGNGIYVTITSSISNDGTYYINSVTQYQATMTKVDPVTHVAIPGWTSFAAMQVTGNVTFTVVEDDQVGGWIGPFFAVPPGEVADRIWLSFLLREGLTILSDDGTRNNRTVSIEIQWRADGAPTWNTTTWSRTASTLDELGETIEIITSGVRPEVRARRTTAFVDSTKYRDKVEWVSLQGKLETPTSYAGVTTLQMKIRGTNALASAAENKVKADITRHLPSYTGGAWQTAAATESIADAALYVLKDAGYTDAQLDLDEFERLRGVWSTRADTFAGVFDRGSTVFDAVRNILAVGYAEPTIDLGMVTPVRDEPRSAWDHVYTPDVMTGKGIERDVVLWDPNEPDGIEVEYFDRTTAKSATVLCQLAGDAGTRPEKIKAFGITDPTRAWRFGMRRRRSLRYLNTKLTWSTELAALNSSYGSYCAVTDGIPGQAQSGRVAAASGVRITCDKVLEWGVGTHYMALRAPDGSLLGPYTAVAVTGDAYSVDLSTGPGTLYPETDGTYQIPTLWTFGPATDWCIPALVKSIKPKGENEVQVEAARYDSRVYADDDNSPP